MECIGVSLINMKRQKISIDAPAPPPPSHAQNARQSFYFNTKFKKYDGSRLHTGYVTTVLADTEVE